VFFYGKELGKNLRACQNVKKETLCRNHIADVEPKTSPKEDRGPLRTRGNLRKGKNLPEKSKKKRKLSLRKAKKKQKPHRGGRKRKKSNSMTLREGNEKGHDIGTAARVESGRGGVLEEVGNLSGRHGPSAATDGVRGGKSTKSTTERKSICPFLKECQGAAHRLCNEG